MRPLLAISAFVVALAAAPQAGAAKLAEPGVFDPGDARAFCGAGDAANAERCFADQRAAADNIERWLDSGEFTRYDARRTYKLCHVAGGPDLRRTWLCVQDRRDKFRSGRDGGRLN